MPSNLLQTKLLIPPTRPIWVPRPHLIDQLNAGLDRILILISAPAGYGKSTLLSEWAHQVPMPVAWLSLEKGDNVASRFWAYFASALQTIPSLNALHIGEELKDLENASPSFFPEDAFTRLVSEIARITDPLILVLDDFHLITDPTINEGLVFVLEHLPSLPGGMHLVISGRMDPPWPMARMRARAEITELRLRDLRFTSEEVTAFLNQTMGLKLSAGEVSQLDARTEGWVAGLQMAALSMQKRDDIPKFLERFSGSHRYILEYLIEEVLNQQPPRVMDFLLKTSILDRLTAPLCDAVMNGQDSQELLTYLEQSNLFVIPLDDERNWYRYHHLFADLLFIRLKNTQPDQVTHLHRRACRWYEARGMLPEALDHALSSGDRQLVAQIVSANVLVLVENDEVLPTLQKIDSVPPEEMVALPWLRIARAWVLGTGQVQKSQQILDAVEMDMENMPDSVERQRLKGHIAALRTYIFSIQGDKVNTIAYAGLANELLPPDEISVRAMNLTMWGDVMSADGHDPSAMPILEQALALALQAEKPHVAMIAAGALASAHLGAGRLREVNRVCQDALEIAEDYQIHYHHQLSATAGIYSMLARVLAEWWEIENAVQSARKGLMLSERWGQVDTDLTGLDYLGRALAFGNDWEQARQVFQRAESASQKISPFFWQMNTIFALDSLLDTEAPAPGEIVEQIRRVQESGAHYPAPLKARLLLRDNQPGEALVVLEQVLSELRGQPSLDIARIHALRALAFQAQGDEKQSLAALRQALELAEPENRVATFVREGVAMEKLLRLALSKSIAPVFVQKLLTAFESRRKPKPEPSLVTKTLVEPLSEREFEVLQLLNSKLSVPEIAQELTVAPSTVRTHVRVVYNKLGVHGRQEAIQKAKDLGLI